MVYDAQYVGAMDNWAATANRMAGRRLLTPQDAQTLRLLDAYGEVLERDTAVRKLQPTAATLTEWDQARTLATAFWQAAATDARISAGFRSIAAQNLALVSPAA